MESLDWVDRLIGVGVLVLSGATLAWCWVTIFEILEAQRWLNK